MRHLIPIASLLVCAVACGDRASNAAADPAADTSPGQGANQGLAAAPAPPPPETQSPVGAMAELKATPGNGVSGTLKLSHETAGVHLTGSIKGLAPNTTHGFHVHEKGDCSAPDASSAGAHYNPAGQPHGNPAAVTRHLGDMPNVTSDAEGVAKLDVVIGGLSLRTGQTNDIVGKSIVVHEKADDYKTQPAGDSGNRIACGIIK